MFKLIRYILKTTCSVGRSIKMCLSSLPGLMRALSKTSALLVEARTMTWSVVPIPEKKGRNVPLFCKKSPRLLTTIFSEIPGFIHTIHLYQQLVESLLLFSIGETRRVGGALLSHSIDLIDVDDAWRSASSLLEQTPHPSSTQAYRQT